MTAPLEAYTAWLNANEMNGVSRRKFRPKLYRPAVFEERDDGDGFKASGDQAASSWRCALVPQ